ncbi:hypothetical protein GCM10025331_16760 [Actinoplanes utahensis]|nr:hypothetical protein Aut01nite_23960 [Actinoplanes utahensis]
MVRGIPAILDAGQAVAALVTPAPRARKAARTPADLRLKIIEGNPGRCGGFRGKMGFLALAIREC